MERFPPFSLQTMPNWQARPGRERERRGSAGTRRVAGRLQVSWWEVAGAVPLVLGPGGARDGLWSPLTRVAGLRRVGCPPVGRRSPGCRWVGSVSLVVCHDRTRPLGGGAARWDGDGSG